MKKMLLIFILTLHSFAACASGISELTIYLIPSTSPLDWGSPSSLYKSARKSFTKSAFRKESYSLGHMFIELSSPLCDSIIMTSIRATNIREAHKMLFKDGYGLSILTSSVEGRMESRSELEKKIEYFSKRGLINFISYRINEESAHRVLDFIRGFTDTTAAFIKSRHYGGSYWARFEGEGGGCTSFGLSALEVAGIKIDYPEWRVKVAIPADLLGGAPTGKKVSVREIKRRESWHDGQGISGIDFLDFEIYDPTYIFRWIVQTLENLSEQFTPIIKNGILGLFLDATDIEPPSEPIFIKRPF